MIQYTRQMVHIFSKYEAQYNSCLIGYGCAEACVPTSAFGSSHGQEEYHKIGQRFMRKKLGICTSVTGITITNSIEIFNQKFDMCVIYFKVKSLMLHCWDHSVKFVDGKFVVCGNLWFPKVTIHLNNIKQLTVSGLCDHSSSLDSPTLEYIHTDGAECLL